MSQFFVSDAQGKKYLFPTLTPNAIPTAKDGSVLPKIIEVRVSLDSTRIMSGGIWYNVARDFAER